MANSWSTRVNVTGDRADQRDGTGGFGHAPQWLALGRGGPIRLRERRKPRLQAIDDGAVDAFDLVARRVARGLVQRRAAREQIAQPVSSGSPSRPRSAARVATICPTTQSSGLLCGVGRCHSSASVSPSSDDRMRPAFSLKI